MHIVINPTAIVTICVYLNYVIIEITSLIVLKLFINLSPEIITTIICI